MEAQIATDKNNNLNDRFGFLVTPYRTNVGVPTIPIL
jgi:hypothetical protein